LQFADWLTNKIYGFAIYGFAICGSMKEICGLAYLRNLRICDCGLSPRICGFKKQLLGHLCKFYSEDWVKLIHEKKPEVKIL
jgi:hypothetical protein